MTNWKERVYASDSNTAPNGNGRAMSPAYERHLYLRRYRRFLPLETTAPVLDIGCGGGGFLDALRSAGCHSKASISARARLVPPSRAG